MLRRRSRSTPTDDMELTAQQPVGVVGGDTSEELVLAAVDGELVNRALDRLSTRHRHVLAMREGSGWTYQQIADHEGVEIGTIETLLWRARQALKREFAVVSESKEALAGFLVATGALIKRTVFRAAHRVRACTRRATAAPAAGCATAWSAQSPSRAPLSRPRSSSPMRCRARRRHRRRFRLRARRSGLTSLGATTAAAAASTPSATTASNGSNGGTSSPAGSGSGGSGGGSRNRQCRRRGVLGHGRAQRRHRRHHQRREPDDQRPRQHRRRRDQRPEQHRERRDQRSRPNGRRPRRTR